MSNKKVFLGGTCNNSTWREKLIPFLKIDFFNPILEVWTDEAYKEELVQREICDFCLYVITSEMKGVYSVAEVVDDSNKKPQKTIFCFLEEGFEKEEIKSLQAVGKMVQQNGAYWLKNMNEILILLNKK